ncbi:MAG: putative enzyme [Microbacterium sp.]|nr:putative enzyme [Microbacterium sp.]
MPVTGPDFLSLQVRDLAASQAFYVRDLVEGTDLDAIAHPGLGVALWLHATGVQEIHDALAADGHRIVQEPFDGPFGRTFAFADPDGYHVTLHDRG